MKPLIEYTAHQWFPCNGEIWDYEKTMHKLIMKDGTVRWAWPNSDNLIDIGFSNTAGEEIKLSDVSFYAEAQAEYDLLFWAVR